MKATDDISLWVEAERHQSPPTGSVERDWERLRHAVNEDAAFFLDRVDAGVYSPPGRTWYSPRVWFATVGIGIAVSIGLGLSVRGSKQGHELRLAQTSATTIHLPAGPSAVSILDERDGASPDLRNIRRGGNAASGQVPRIVSGRSQARGSSPPPQRAAENQNDDRFSLELDLIRRAKSALDDGNTREASALIQQHRDRYPGGVFVTEREALRVLALCQSGNSGAARRAAMDFLASHPRSLHEDRVRRACLLQSE